jgi:hypothetical protein
MEANAQIAKQATLIQLAVSVHQVIMYQIPILLLVPLAQ